jgi:hypothetical protein
MIKMATVTGWIAATLGALMLAGTVTASAGELHLRGNVLIDGLPGCRPGSTDCTPVDIGQRIHRGEGGHSYRRYDDRRHWRHDDRRHWRHDDHRRVYRHRPRVGIHIGPAIIPNYRFVEPHYRYMKPRHSGRIVLSRAHVNWCENRYRSYRAWDNTFQPYHGPRKQCWSPYS